MTEAIDAGISANPIPATKHTNTPLASSSYSL
jgi:hypothetical protein